MVLTAVCYDVIGINYIGNREWIHCQPLVHMVAITASGLLICGINRCVL